MKTKFIEIDCVEIGIHMINTDYIYTVTLNEDDKVVIQSCINGKTASIVVNNTYEELMSLLHVDSLPY